MISHLMDQLANIMCAKENSVNWQNGTEQTNKKKPEKSKLNQENEIKSKPIQSNQSSIKLSHWLQINEKQHRRNETNKQTNTKKYDHHDVVDDDEK